MRWKDTLFCRTRNDRGFIARCMFTSESKKRISLWVVSGLECVCSVEKRPKNNTLFNCRFGPECFYYKHLFSTCKLFGRFISPLRTCESFGHLHYSVQSKKRSWRQLFRSRLIMRMMQYFWKSEKILQEGSCGFILSGAVFVPVPNLGLLDQHTGCRSFCHAVVTCKSICEVCGAKYVVCCNDRRSFRNKGTLPHTQVKRNSNRKCQNF